VAVVPGRTRIIQAILVAAVAITPLALVTGIFISHDVIPKVILLATCAALLLFLLPWWLPLRNALRAQSTGRLFLILILAQFASLLVSTVFSSQFPQSLAGTVWRRFGLIEQTAGLVIAAALACVAASRPTWIPTLLKGVAVCGGLAATYGILQYFNLDPFLERSLYAIDYFGGVVRPPSTLGHALYFSAYLIPVLFLSLAAALGDAAMWWRRVHAATAILAGVAIVLSGTRSAMIAAGAGGILFAWRVMRGQTRNSPVRLLAAASSLLLATAVFVVSPAGANLRNRMLQWRTESGGPRLQMWRECPALIGRHLLLGSGPETFAAEFRKIQSVELSREYPDFYNETPHNAFLDAACAQGIPGVLILAGVFALVWFAGRNGIARRTPMMWGIEAGMLGILISSMFASLTLVTSLYLWSMAGLAVAVARGGAQGADAVVARREPWFLRVPAAVLGVFFLAAGISFVRQDAAWSDLGATVEARDFAGARDAWSRATLFGPGLPGYELWGSRELALLGRALGNTPEGAAAWKMAASSASLAEAEGEERFSAAYQSSVLAVAAGDARRAEFEARETIRLAPNWYKGHLLLSQILQITGNNGEAAREARVSETLGWKKSL
jgi:O-antigen ligase